MVWSKVSLEVLKEMVLEPLMRQDPAKLSGKWQTPLRVGMGVGTCVDTRCPPKLLSHPLTWM